MVSLKIFGIIHVMIFINFFVEFQNELKELAFVQYSFDRQEHPVDLRPHGNSKGKQLFKRTKPSVIQQLKEASKNKPPKKVLREIENIQGGVMGAKSGCDQ